MQPTNNNQDRPPKNGAPKGQKNGQRRGGGKPQGQKPQGVASNLTTSRGQAVRAQRRSQSDAQRIANQYVAADSTKPMRANVVDDTPRLKLIGLGGMDGG